MKSDSETVIIIPDLHQDISWAKSILKKEPSCDAIVFLGDYFDPARGDRRLASPEETIRFLASIISQYRDRVTLLLGNHDIQYLESLARLQKGLSPEPVNYGCGPSWWLKTALALAECDEVEILKNARLFIYSQNYLISHAGVDRIFWKRKTDVESALHSLEIQTDYALSHIDQTPLPLLGAGKVRGGTNVIGGITWLDWEHEFEDTLPVPQIVGHSKDPMGARSKGRSWCIDGNQTIYAKLINHSLSIKTP